MIEKIPTERLKWNFDHTSLVEQIVTQKRRFKYTHLSIVTQERALAALELGLGIRQRGFNIFAVGAPGTGRTSAVKQILQKRALQDKTPDDIVLLYNFSNRDRPLALAIPSSYGPKLKKTYDTLVERMLHSLEKAFESDLYLTRRQDIQDKCHIQTANVLTIIEEEAKKEGFVLTRGAGSLTLTPANEKGIAITEEEFEVIPDSQKELLEQSAEKLESRLEDTIRKIRTLERESEDDIENLEKQTAEEVINPLFESAKSTWKNRHSVLEHLDAMKEDILSHLRQLLPNDRNQTQENEPNPKNQKRFHSDEDEDDTASILVRYQANVLVTHVKGSGAPVVHETHPTTSNLIGRIEQRMRAGETVTDHTRIRAGALYLANGGYLILDAQDLLRDPSAWEGLKRALKNHAIELDDPGEPGRMVSVASIRPEPVSLSLKVVLIGIPEIYYMLSKNDPDFSKLFKVKADFDLEIERSDDRIQKYLHFLFDLAHRENTKPLTPAGAGRIMEYAVRMAGNQNKLTTRLSDIADLMREANFWAFKQASKKIDLEHVQRALEARKERNGYLEDHLLEDILKGRIHIETDDDVIGQCNALTVVELGSYEFGVPLRITCRVSSGRGEIIDIERETQLGGPIHTKGTLIIRGLLADRFGLELPLGLTAHICMEQTYTDIDGDSASLAEACALFSTLAQAPIAQRYAITGSIDQRGRVQAIGGVNEKIEGFFKVCQAMGGSKLHGVVIPKSNIPDLMLSEEVIEACKQNRFEVLAVEDCNDALKILTGRDWQNGANNLKEAIQKTLKHLHSIRQRGHEHLVHPPVSSSAPSLLNANAQTKS